MADRGWVPLVWPVPSAPPPHSITQGFGANAAWYREKWGWTIGHSGLDIRTRTAAFPGGVGTPIVAARGGLVRRAGEHPNGYGITVELEHPDSTRTLYGHLSWARVQVGQRVMAGQRIGDAGQTGAANGPHLHFELWKPPFDVPGVWGRVDPTYLFETVLVEPATQAHAMGLVAPPSLMIEREDEHHCGCAPFVPEP
jgi:murein DD-endopeptidase MepM/ murein hydrolase activator NlpD